MKTILFFHTSTHEAWRKELAGLYRFSHTVKWNIQIVEPSNKPPAIKRLLDFWTPDGCIVECSGREAEYFDATAFASVPTVYIGRDPRTLPKDSDCINADPSGPGQIAAKVFLSAGIRHFAFYAASKDRFWSRDREAFFRKALRLNGFPRCEAFGRTSISRNNTQKLTQWLKELAKPCGLFAENDYAAADVLAAAHRARIRVPEELSVIGTDDDSELCENMTPRLSSIFLDFEAAGYKAAERLDQRMTGRTSRLQNLVTYPAVSLIRRNSTPHVYAEAVPPKILRALEIIRQKACDGITPSEVAAALGIPRRTLDMHFRIATRKTLLDEIHNVRFEKVLYLLRTKSIAIDAIADQTGWGTKTALRTAFLKRYGKSMRDWRENQTPPVNHP